VKGTVAVIVAILNGVSNVWKKRLAASLVLLQLVCCSEGYIIFQKSLLTSQEHPSTPLRGSSSHYCYGHSRSAIRRTPYDNFSDELWLPRLETVQIYEVQNGWTGGWARTCVCHRMCRQIEICRRFGGSLCLRFQGERIVLLWGMKE
jgi:hypothetical protein